jgi:hypothetical protein
MRYLELRRRRDGSPLADPGLERELRRLSARTDFANYWEAPETLRRLLRDFLAVRRS